MIVLDASALLDVIVPGRRSFDAAALLARDETFHAPHLIDVECAQAIRRETLAGRLTPERGQSALRTLAAFPLTRYPHTLHLERVWSLRGNLTAYDAAYVALAEALDAVLVTRDATLAAAPGLGARVELV